MRKHAKNWLMKVVLGIIIVVFVFYFGSLRGRRQTETIAVLNKIPITHSEFVKEYQNVIEIYRQRFGNNLSDDLLKALNPKQQAFDNLINKAIILTKAEEFKLNISEEELKASIYSYPAFQRNGVFDKKIYEQRLRFQRLTPEDFEEMQKRMLRIDKLERLIRESVKVSETEVYDIYRLQNEKINVDFIKIAAKNFENKVVPAEEELAKYLKEHGEDFRIPKKAEMHYISFPGSNFTEQYKVSDEEVEEYYNYHQDEFTDSEKKVAPLSEVKDTIISKLKLMGGMDIALGEAKKAHDTIYQEENFEEYAKENNLKIRTAEILYGEQAPVKLARLKGLNDYAFSSEEGEIITVISDDKEHYVFKLISIKPSYIPNLTEVRKKVEKTYIGDASQKLCKERAESILERLKKGEDIRKLSEDEGIKLSETGLFLPGSDTTEMGFSQEIGEALFEISEKKPYPDNVFFIDGSYIVLRFKEKGQLDEKDWEEKKYTFMNALIQMKGEKLFQLWLQETKNLMIEKGELELLQDIDSL
jgi:peptidyl-prolyl cis-trans isomerase D